MKGNNRPSDRKGKDKVVGELVENRVVIWDRESSRRLYSLGFYGKPLGIPKPKNLNFDAPLVLDLLESYYLLKRGLIEIVDARGARVGENKLRKICEREYSMFNEKYLAYEALRDKGYVVTAGIKFGCDFAVYEHGPGIDHAPFLVNVLRPDDSITANYVVLAGRLATTVRKQFVLAIASKRKVDFLVLDWWKP